VRPRQDFNQIPKAELKNMEQWFQEQSEAKYQRKKMVITNYKVSLSLSLSLSLSKMVITNYKVSLSLSLSLSKMVITNYKVRSSIH